MTPSISVGRGVGVWDLESVTVACEVKGEEGVEVHRAMPDVANRAAYSRRECVSSGRDSFGIVRTYKNLLVRKRKRGT